MSWSQHEPTFDFEPPRGDLTWSIEGEAPSRFSENLDQALDEWQVSMACRFHPHRVSEPKQAMVTFICAEPPYSPADHGKIATGQIVEDGSTVVWVKPELCDGPGNLFVMHAVGHALGLADSQEWYPTTMDGFSIMPEAWTGEIPRLERDGHRIWALNHGAPGCGDRDPQWSWVERPDYYSGETPDLDSLLNR
jgi:hypothetical protein